MQIDSLHHVSATHRAKEERQDVQAWGLAVAKPCAALRNGIGTGGVRLEKAPDELLAELEEMATSLSSFEEAHGKARQLVLGWIPPFVYITDFPELSGHQNLADYVQRRSEGHSCTEAEKNFEKLAQVAGFDPKEIHGLQNDHEQRQT